MSKTEAPVIEAIEQAFWDRAEALDLNVKTKKFRDEQAAFFAGAIAALHNSDPDKPTNGTLSNRVPIGWILSIMRGDAIGK